jgi:hypothetical protein
MLNKSISIFLKNILTEEEKQSLRIINLIENSEIRNTHLREFFHNPLIFDKIKTSVDPTWLSYSIFINGKNYEF